MRAPVGSHRTLLVAGLVVTVMLLAGGLSVAVHGWPGAGSAGVPASPAATAQALVQLGPDAAGGPDAATVGPLLERHFAAINQRDYDSWTSTVTPGRVAAFTRQHWLEQYRSTVDSDVVISRIVATGSGDLVALSFISEQNPVDAPQDLRARRICWTSTWPITGGRIGTPATGVTSKRGC